MEVIQVDRINGRARMVIIEEGNWQFFFALIKNKVKKTVEICFKRVADKAPNFLLRRAYKMAGAILKSKERGNEENEDKAQQRTL